MTNFKIPLQKELLQVGDILILLTGDAYCHGQVIFSSVYAILIMYHGNLGCMFIATGYMHLFRDIEIILVPGHS